MPVIFIILLKYENKKLLKVNIFLYIFLLFLREKEKQQDDNLRILKEIFLAFNNLLLKIFPIQTILIEVFKASKLKII